MHTNEVPREQREYALSSWLTLEPYTSVLGRDGKIYSFVNVIHEPWDPAFTLWLIAPNGNMFDIKISPDQPCVIVQSDVFDRAEALLIAAFGPIERIES